MFGVSFVALGAAIEPGHDPRTLKTCLACLQIGFIGFLIAHLLVGICTVCKTFYARKDTAKTVSMWQQHPTLRMRPFLPVGSPESFRASGVRLLLFLQILIEGCLCVALGTCDSLNHWGLEKVSDAHMGFMLAWIVAIVLVPSTGPIFIFAAFHDVNWKPVTVEDGTTYRSRHHNLEVNATTLNVRDTCIALSVSVLLKVCLLALLQVCADRNGWGESSRLSITQRHYGTLDLEVHSDDESRREEVDLGE